MFLLGRELGVSLRLSGLMTLSYALSKVTTRYLVTVWEATTSQTLSWLMVPVFSFALVKFLRCEDSVPIFLDRLIFGLDFNCIRQWARWAILDGCQGVRDLCGCLRHSRAEAVGLLRVGWSSDVYVEERLSL